jgi:hypothetical protein
LFTKDNGSVIVVRQEPGCVGGLPGEYAIGGNMPLGEVVTHCILDGWPWRGGIGLQVSTRNLTGTQKTFTTNCTTVHKIDNWFSPRRGKDRKQTGNKLAMEEQSQIQNTRKR